jgi:hypothetical protein
LSILETEVGVRDDTIREAIGAALRGTAVKLTVGELGVSKGLADAIGQMLAILGIEQHDAVITKGEEAASEVLLVTAAGLLQIKVSYGQLVTVSPMSRMFNVTYSLVPWERRPLTVDIQAAGQTAGDVWIESARANVGSSEIERPIREPTAPFDEFVAAALARQEVGPASTSS